MKARGNCQTKNCGTNRVFGPLGIFSNEMEDLLTSVLGEDTKARGMRPVASITESDTGYSIFLELPGVTIDDISVEVHEGQLTISGEKKFALPEGQKWLRQERIGGTFQRQFQFNQAVELDKISARFENGVLKIEVPKTEQAQPRKIEIQAG